MKSLERMFGFGKKTIFLVVTAFTILNPFNRINAQDSTYIKAMLNPFLQPRETLIYYGSGDVDSNETVDWEDYDLMSQGVENDMADVDGDGTPSTSHDKQLLQDYLDGSTEYLPAWWEWLKTREEREDWVKKLMAIDKTDTLHYVPGEFDSGEFANQLGINTYGYPVNDIPSKYDTTMNGRFNIPLYQVTVYKKDGSWGHGMTAVLEGDSPLNFDDWNFIEPQNDSTGVQPGEWNIPYDSKTWIFGIDHFTGSGTVFPFTITGFEIDSTGNPTLIYQLEDLVLERDTANVAIAGEQVMPLRYSLKQNYPNPFNPRTTIEYNLPKREHVSLDIYNIRGRKLETLVDGVKDLGRHRMLFNASNYPSGVYFYRLRTESGYNEVKKMVVVK